MIIVPIFFVFLRLSCSSKIRRVFEVLVWMRSGGPPRQWPPEAGTARKRVMTVQIFLHCSDVSIIDQVCERSVAPN